MGATCLARGIRVGNDDFGARYYTSRLGRWLSADWSSEPAPVPYANLTNPQTLNLYAMVSDNPETFADLDGHDGWFSDLWNSFVTGAAKELSNQLQQSVRSMPAVSESLGYSDIAGGQTPLQEPSNGAEAAGMAAVVVAPVTLGTMGAEEEPGIVANAEKGAASEAKILSELGEAKNTQPVTGTEGKSIPDFQNKTTVGEVKDAKAVSNTKQLRIQKEGRDVCSAREPRGFRTGLGRVGFQLEG